MKRTFKLELRMLNRARKELGLAPMTEMPKATPGSSRSCLIATALGFVVGVRFIGKGPRQYLITTSDVAKQLRKLWHTGGRFSDEVYLPPILDRLADAFDHHRIPELIT